METEITLDPRFAAYAREQGRNVVDQLAFDQRRYGEKRVTGFLIWVQGMIAKFKNVRPEAFMWSTLIDADAFDAWLDERTITELG